MTCIYTLMEPSTYRIKIKDNFGSMAGVFLQFEARIE